MWFGYTMVLARLLSQADFGLVMYAINIILLAAPIATVGFEKAVLRYGSQYWSDHSSAAFQALVSQSRRTAFLGGIACCVVLVASTFTNIVAPMVGQPLIVAFTGLAIIASAVMMVHRSILRSADRLVEALTGSSYIRTIVPTLGVLIFAAYEWLTPATAIALFVCGVGASLAFEMWRIAKLWQRQSQDQDRDDIAQLRRAHSNTALGVWPGDLGNIILARSGGIIVGMVLGLEEVALFIAAEQISRLGQFLTDAVRTAAAPRVAQAASSVSEDKTNLQEATAQSSLLMFLSGAFGCLGLVVLGWPLLWLLGPSYTDAFPLLLLFLLAQTSWTVFGPTAMVMNMTGLERARSIGAIVAALASFGVSWLGAVNFGVLGAALGFALVSWLMNLGYVYIIARKLGVSIGITTIRREDLTALAQQTRRYGEKLRQRL